MGDSKERSLRNQRRSQPLQSVDWVMLGVGFVAGLVVAGLVVVIVRYPQPEELPPTPPAPVAAAPATAKLQFHKLLRETEVVVPDTQMAPWQPRDRAERLLQVGAFRGWAEAEQLRGRLSLQRLEPFIESVEIGGNTWHRVQLGPFDSLPLLNSAQSKLRTLEIASLVIVRPAHEDSDQEDEDKDAAEAAVATP